MFSKDQLELIQGAGIAFGIGAAGATLALYWTIISVAPFGACGSTFATGVCTVVHEAERLGYVLGSLTVCGFLAVFGTEYQLKQKRGVGE